MDEKTKIEIESSLKAKENNRLKAKLKKVKIEVKKLKEQIASSVELPCLIGDIIYLIGRDNEEREVVLEGEVESVTVSRTQEGGRVFSMYCLLENGLRVWQHLSSFNERKWFKTRDEALQQLSEEDTND